MAESVGLEVAECADGECSGYCPERKIIRLKPGLRVASGAPSSRTNSDTMSSAIFPPETFVYAPGRSMPRTNGRRCA